MVCPYCASSNIITIKGVGFCVNCGHSLAKTAKEESAIKRSLPITLAAKPNPPQPTATKPIAKIEIKSRHQIGRAASVAQTAPRRRAMSDISRPRPTPQPTAKSVPKPPPQNPTPSVVSKPAAAVERPVKPSATRPSRHQHRHSRVRPLKRSRVVTASSLVTGILAGALVEKSYLVIHVSRASTPGGFFHFLATRSHHTKLLLAALAPAAVIGAFTVVAIWQWTRASAIYTASRLHDHRPVGAGAANRAGLNALGSLLALDLIALIVAGVWLGGLVAVIKSLSSLSLGYWQVAAIGVAASFGMVLIGLWLGAGLILAGYGIVLAGGRLGKALASGLRLASRDYTNVAVTVLGLLITLGIILALILAAMIGLTQTSWHPPVWAVAGLAGALSAALLGWFAQFSLGRWVGRYRLSVARVYGPDRAPHYLSGRHPKAPSRVGLSLTVIWWLLVAIIGSGLLWHYRIDPSGLLTRLAATIY